MLNGCCYDQRFADHVVIIKFITQLVGFMSIDLFIFIQLVHFYSVDLIPFSLAISNRPVYPV